jgi:ADP-ribosylglycohydrolase
VSEPTLTSQASPDERLKRAICSLEGLSIGDAYGNHHGNNAKKRLSAQWDYSDDTVMALSLVSNLRQFGTINQDALAYSFAQRRDGMRGYGQGVTRLLKAVATGKDWRELTTSMFEGDGSFGNGAAMRIAPLGAYFSDNLDQLIEQARHSAEVTHMHPEAIAVAVAAALVWQNKQRGTLQTRPEFLQQINSHIPDSAIRNKIEVAANLPIGTVFRKAADVLGNGRPAIAQQTVPFSLWAAAESLTDFEYAVEQTSRVGGDIDTNCYIVGGIVVMATGVESIPANWMTRREALPSWYLEES